jgi:hypothetical protein
MFSRVMTVINIVVDLHSLRVSQHIIVLGARRQHDANLQLGSKSGHIWRGVHVPTHNIHVNNGQEQQTRRQKHSPWSSHVAISVAQFGIHVVHVRLEAGPAATCDHTSGDGIRFVGESTE